MPGSLSIRPARSSDLDRILRIENASFGRDAYDRNLFAEFFRKCRALFLVAVRRRNVCGYIVTCIGGSTAGERAELVSVAVDPKQRGRGVATGLMESTLRRLRRRGVVRFHLMVKVTNKPAIAFYEKYGFQREKLVRRYYGDGADGRKMVKVLEQRFRKRGGVEDTSH